jgi:hypothetical protein
MSGRFWHLTVAEHDDMFAANTTRSRLNQIINHLKQCGGVYPLVAAAAGNFNIGSIPPNQPGLLPIGRTSATDVNFFLFNGGNSTTTIDAGTFANADPVTQTRTVVHEWWHTMQINNSSRFVWTNVFNPQSVEDDAEKAASEAIQKCGPG